MGNSNTTNCINYEDMQYGINHKEYIIINTLTITNDINMIPFFKKKTSCLTRP